MTTPSQSDTRKVRAIDLDNDLFTEIKDIAESSRRISGKFISQPTIMKRALVRGLPFVREELGLTSVLDPTFVGKFPTKKAMQKALVALVDIAYEQLSNSDNQPIPSPSQPSEQ